MHFEKGKEGSGLWRGTRSPVLTPLPLEYWILGLHLFLLAIYSPDAVDSHNSSSTRDLSSDLDVPLSTAYLLLDVR